MKLDPISPAQRALISKLYGEIDPDFGARRAETFFGTFPNRGEAGCHGRAAPPRGTAGRES